MDGKNGRSMMTGLLALVTALAALSLFLAAVWRWHDNDWGASIWLVAFVAMTVIRTPHSLRNRANVVVDADKDIVEKLLLTAMFLAMMLLPLCHLGTPLFRFADYSLPDWATAIGAVLQGPFLWLFWRSHADLGRNWSPGLEVREDHRLVTGGIYASMRNPMYAAIWLSALAQPLLIHNWIGGALVVPAFAAMWFLRVPNEEALMRRRFGAEWDAYCLRAGRLWPKRPG
ncbi:Protein-S-isoprenylcysteine O-methyltransferase Ste14 [Sphingopyxis sp. YR583]|jgi:protein-S-isoprenylcysteine O-methyltransferase Ste14|uniref:protein-S-isoprenylcysteine O-methyltransferase n=1 Tax=Sphingopyxis sp. YR583 TaxID=1881047 RepID=UPI0008A7B32F|nr:protein-S-isoprenylcysteine O-methyltransferase [Sphingopyxis sp. YR583]SEH12304.1 Protein-S-isoprenylcysteine O-methyltransferase Ste14 [Sphingopyxis sp. YR583]